MKMFKRKRDGRLVPFIEAAAGFSDLEVVEVPDPEPMPDIEDGRLVPVVEVPATESPKVFKKVAK